MTNPLTNSMNQVSEEEKRRKRKAEIKAQMTKLAGEGYGMGDQLKTLRNTPMLWQLKAEYESLDY